MLTEATLVAALREIRHPGHVEVTYQSEPKLKAGCPHKGVVKISKIMGRINYDYQDEVNAKRVAEGTGSANFAAAKRTWGERIPGTCLIQHKGQFYLDILPDDAHDRVTYKNAEQAFSREDLAPWLPPERTTESDSQVLEKSVRPRDLKINGILWIRMGEILHEIVRPT